MDYKTWLPQNSIFDGVILRQFDISIEQWAGKWFKSLPVFHSAFSPIVKKSVLGDGDFWQSENERLSASLSPSGRHTLAANILGVETLGASIADADQKLCVSIVSECFVDLLEILANLFEIDSKLAEINMISNAQEGFGELAIKDEVGENIAIVNIAQKAMVAFRRNGLIDKTLHFDDDKLEQALSQQKVNLGAYVGNSRISLGDLEGLNSGDIIVIDKHVGTTINMTVNNKIASGIECGIVQNDNQINLQITKFNIED